MLKKWKVEVKNTMKNIKYNGYDLGFIIGTYLNNGRLYVGLINKEGENYCDLTINISDYMLEFENEIIINGDTSKELIELLEDMGILIDTYKVAFSGFGKYDVMIFNKDIAKDYILKEIK